MSLINRVLNELEQRGAHPSPEQTLIRAVPARAERRWQIPALLALLATSLVAGWLLWPKTRAPAVAAAQPVVPAPTTDNLPQLLLQPAAKLSYELSALPPEQPPAAPAVEPARATKPDSASRPPAQPQKTAPKPAANPSSAAREPSAASMPLKQISSGQQAEAEYHKAELLQQRGQQAEALAGYEAALKLDAKHEAARLAQAALLLAGRRGAEAERVLQEGVRLKPQHIPFGMALARVQVESGKVGQALDTLQANLPQADENADYQAFYAALLQRQGRHKEAINNYQIALQLAPGNGIWQIGYAISLQAVQRPEDAKAAYQRALATQTLTPELTAFVQQKLKGL